MSKLESLVKRYEFIKKMWVNSSGTSDQASWESQLNQIIQEMETYNKSQGIGVRTDPADKVRNLLDYALLCASELKRQLLVIERVECLAHTWKHKTTATLMSRGATRLDGQLHAQQFVELKAVLRLPKSLCRLRKVDVVHRFAQRH